MLTIDLLRHGALQGGVKYRGLLDDPLTLEGRQAMDEVWQRVQGDVTQIISSPLSRCAIPAQAWAENSGVPCLLEPQLQELHYGDWEGLTGLEIQAQYPGMLEEWRQNPDGMCPPHGEPMTDFSARIQLLFQQLLRQHQHGHILLVVHSGTMRLLLAHVLQAPIVSTRHLSMPYACWSRLKVVNDIVMLDFHAKQASHSL
ncbi:MAG: histidine phosphatase family protein [Ghiorsea sp.]